MKTPLIEFKDVTKRFGSKTVLDRVNLQIYEGEVTTAVVVDRPTARAP